MFSMFFAIDSSTIIDTSFAFVWLLQVWKILKIRVCLISGGQGKLWTIFSRGKPFLNSMSPGRKEIKNRMTTAEVGGNTTFVNQWSLANAWFKIIVNWIHYLSSGSIANNHCYLKTIIYPGLQHKWQHELELQLHTARHQGGSRPKVINFFLPFPLICFVKLFCVCLFFAGTTGFLGFALSFCFSPEISFNKFSAGARIYQSAAFRLPQSSLAEILAPALAST